MLATITKRRFWEVRVTRDNPRYCSANWFLFANRYESRDEAENAVERALTTGTHPYRGARIIEEYSVEGR
jgi:hypothetical protein